MAIDLDLIGKTRHYYPVGYELPEPGDLVQALLRPVGHDPKIRAQLKSGYFTFDPELGWKDEAGADVPADLLVIAWMGRDGNRRAHYSEKFDGSFLDHLVRVMSGDEDPRET